jgi:hypothetical protein
MKSEKLLRERVLSNANDDEFGEEAVQQRGEKE